VSKITISIYTFTVRLNLCLSAMFLREKVTYFLNKCKLCINKKKQRLQDIDTLQEGSCWIYPCALQHIRSKKVM
jgi:hypothetical protein